MPARTKAQIEKAADRRALAEVNTITVTIAASELNLQRLAALLLFCEHLEPVVKIGGPEKPMPWENPDDPRFIEGPPALEIDFETVRRSIMRHLQAYVLKHGEERARAVLTSFGASRLSSVPQEQLLDLDAALAAALQEKPEKPK